MFIAFAEIHMHMRRRVAGALSTDTSPRKSRA
jgi:hypothetical protein